MVVTSGRVEEAASLIVYLLKHLCGRQLALWMLLMAFCVALVSAWKHFA